MLPWYSGYWVSDDGRIWSDYNGRELKPKIDHGYYRMSLMNVYGPPRQRFVLVNRVVCWHFNGPYPDDGEDYQAAHLDCDKNNNNWWNLEWQTPAENSNHPVTRARNSAAQLAHFARRRRMFNSEWLAAYRAEHGLTRTELAELTGFGASTLHYWETGRRAPYRANLHKLAEALGVPVETLLH